MAPLDVLVHVLLVPGAVAGVLALLGAFLPSGEGAAGPRGRVAALGVAAGFVAGLWGLGLRPALPLADGDDAWQWVVWLAPAGAILGAAESAARLRGALALLLRAAICAAAAWTILRGLHPHAIDGGELALRAAGFGIAGAALWTAGVHLSERRPLVTWLPALAVALGGAGFLLLEAGHAASMAQAAGVLAAAVAAVAIVLLVRRTSPFPAEAAPVVALTFVGLLSAAHGYLNYGSVVRFPLGTTAALLLAPMVGLALPKALREKKPWIVGALVTMAVAVGVVAVATLLAPLGEDPYAY